MRMHHAEFAPVRRGIAGVVAGGRIKLQWGDSPAPLGTRLAEERRILGENGVRPSGHLSGTGRAAEAAWLTVGRVRLVGSRKVAHAPVIARASTANMT